MKFLVVLSVAVACVASAVVDESAAPVLKSEYDSSPEGSYQFAYETGNGIAAQVTGSLKSIPGENPAVAAVGAFKYTSPEGQPIELSYVADENGFQPSGSHLPVPPPIPELIARALRYLEANPPAPVPVKSFAPQASASIYG